MGSSLSVPSVDAAWAAQPGAAHLLRVITLVRYRFFLYAGLLPVSPGYGLGVR